jgi:hypothetical protein
MNEQEIENGVKNIVDKVTKNARLEINPTNIIDIGNKKILFNLLKKDIRNELLNIKKDYRSQSRILIKHSKNDISDLAFEKKILDYDYFYSNKIDYNKEFKEDLLEYYYGFSNGIKLLTESGIDDFAKVIELNGNIGFLDIILDRGEIYKKHSDNIELIMSIDKSKIPLRNINYTKEGVRVINQSEDKTKKILNSKY